MQKLPCKNLRIINELPFARMNIIMKEVTKGCDCESCTIYTGCIKGFCPFEKHTLCKQKHVLKTRSTKKLIKSLTPPQA